MAFFLRLRRVHTLTNPFRSLSLLHHHLLPTPNSGAGDLLHLRRFHTLTTPSLLHHHGRHLSTSNSGDDPNSNNPSPSALRELRDAIQQLSASDYIAASKTPTCTIFSFVPSSNSNVVPDSSAAASGKLDEKLHQIKTSVLSLGKRQSMDRQSLWKLKQSRIDLHDEVLKNLANHLSLVQKHKCRALSPETREMLVEEIDGIIAELMRLNEMIAEAANLLEMLTDSRLASLEEIVKNLSEIRGDLQDELWDELNEGLVRCEQTELKEAELLALEMREHMELLIPEVQNLFQIRHSYL